MIQQLRWASYSLEENSTFPFYSCPQFQEELLLIHMPKIENVALAKRRKMFIGWFLDNWLIVLSLFQKWHYKNTAQKGSTESFSFFFMKLKWIVRIYVSLFLPLPHKLEFDWISQPLWSRRRGGRLYPPSNSKSSDEIILHSIYAFQTDSPFISGYVSLFQCIGGAGYKILLVTQ